MELALISPVLVLLVMGVLDLGRAYRLDIRLENAAREGAAFAQIYPTQVSCGSSGNILARAEAEEPSLQSTPDFEVRVLRRQGGSWVPVTGCVGPAVPPGSRVRVEARARYDIATPFVGSAVGNSFQMTGAAEVRVQGKLASL